MFSGELVSLYRASAGLSAMLALVCFASFSVMAEQISESEFDPNAELIDLNNLPPGIALDKQLAVHGVVVSSVPEEAILFVDTAAQALSPPLQPVAFSVDSLNPEISFEFASPRSQVGINYRIPEGDSIAMFAFDSAGNVIDSAQASGTTANYLGRSVSEADFVGLATETPDIARATVVYYGQTAASAFDDLLLYPAHEDSVDISTIMPSLLPGMSQDQKLDALNQLLLLPSPVTTQALLDTATNDADGYVRERALLALGQHYDISALPGLVNIALNDTDPYVGTAARNAVHELRKQWPIPDPPEIEFTSTGPFKAGEPFTVAATVTSPVARDRVLLRAEFREPLLPVDGSDFRGWETSLEAGVPVVYEFDVVSDIEERGEIVVVAEISLNLVDYASYRQTLYVDVNDSGGSSSNEIFPDVDPPTEVVLPAEEQ